MSHHADSPIDAQGGHALVAVNQEDRGRYIAWTRGKVAQALDADWVERVLSGGEDNSLGLQQFVRLAAKRRAQSEGAITADTLAEVFCKTELPAGVCADPCATMPDYPHQRLGTNLLTVAQAKSMFDRVLDKVTRESIAQSVAAVEQGLAEYLATPRTEPQPETAPALDQADKRQAEAVLAERRDD